MGTYYLYHDESKENGYWHGILLVPVKAKAILFDYLEQARKNTSYFGEIGLKRVKKEASKVYRCAQAWLQIGVAALIQDLKGKPYPLYLGRCVKGKKEYALFEQPIKAKFILFRERDNFRNMTGHKDYGSKVETTFRMGLKGGLHRLGSPQNPIRIEALHFDGHEHYQRHLDQDRILGRLYGLRDYCGLNAGFEVIDDRTSNHTKTQSQAYEDCQLLQLTDVLVGSFRTVLGSPTREIHRDFAHPVKILVDKYQQGAARMKRSRWKDGFCISQCYLEDGVWQFEAIGDSSNAVAKQQDLFPVSC